MTTDPGGARRPPNATPPGRGPLDVRQQGEVTVVRFRGPVRLDGPEAEGIAEQLLSLVQDAGRCRLVVNLGGVQALNSATLGKLITVHKKALPLGGRLALCCTGHHLQQILETVKLSVLIGLYETEEEAVASFRMP
jgi:anti-sigma B factor antagonist